MSLLHLVNELYAYSTIEWRDSLIGVEGFALHCVLILMTRGRHLMKISSYYHNNRA